ncbi:hypothetical protein PaG_03686 [Moesziomyces aphidis]|uniref:Putative peroxiredoxin n=2 Tax=Moesziomyces TaxID=63261 RepID=M9LRY5_PSEA3|nr:hypothetical protein PaG_03686 [Moesziomyces aphidis]GAC76066.1 hypothetical protein PANT_19d00096 [Moesziomyces antarcticus T-34]
MVSKLVMAPVLRTAGSLARPAVQPIVLPASRRLISSASSPFSATTTTSNAATLRNAFARNALGPCAPALGSSCVKSSPTLVRGLATAAQTISKGEQIPNSTFMYVPFTSELADGTACGAPTKVQTHEAFKGKKVVIIAVPGAYTPTCHVNHIPPFIKQVDAFKAKGVDQIVVLAQNDPFVMSAWGVQNKAEDKVIFATDLGLEFSKGVGSTADLSAMGFGMRTGRYALIVDDLKVVDFSPEPNPGAVETSSAEAVLSKL